MRKPTIAKLGKLIDHARSLPPPEAIKSRGLLLMLGEGRYCSLGDDPGKISGEDRARMEAADNARAECRDGIPLEFVALQYRDEVHHATPIDPRDPRELERTIAATAPVAAQPRVVTEEDLRVARYLDKFGVEVYLQSADELQAEVNNLMLRNNRGLKLADIEIDRLAAYNMRLEQIKGANQ